MGILWVLKKSPRQSAQAILTPRGMGILWVLKKPPRQSAQAILTPRGMGILPMQVD